MAQWGSAFNLISLVYMGLAALTLARLLRLGPSAFAEPLGPDRARLISATAFYLVTPVAVALHELGHVLLIAILGGRIVDYHFMLYWGYVVPDRSFGPYGDLAVALAGNLVSAALGTTAAWVVLYRPRKAAWNLLWARVAEIQLSLTLVLYPLFCLMGFGGDFTAIYRRDTLPASAPLLAAHLIALAALWRARRRTPGKLFQLHASQLWDRIRAAERFVATHPTDPQPELVLAATYLQADSPAEAYAHAQRAVSLAPGAAVARLLLGLAAEKAARPEAAGLLEPVLDDPGLDSSLAQAGRLALARARLASEDSQGGLEASALKALAFNPKDAEAAELVADAARQSHSELVVIKPLEKAAAENLAARRELELLERWLRRRQIVPDDL